MGWGKYHIVLPETQKVLLTVAWGSVTEAAVVLDVIDLSHFTGSVSQHETVCKHIEVSGNWCDLNCRNTYYIHSSFAQIKLWILQ